MKTKTNSDFREDSHNARVFRILFSLFFGMGCGLVCLALFPFGILIGALICIYWNDYQAKTNPNSWQRWKRDRDEKVRSFFDNN